MENKKNFNSLKILLIIFLILILLIFAFIFIRKLIWKMKYNSRDIYSTNVICDKSKNLSENLLTKDNFNIKLSTCEITDSKNEYDDKDISFGFECFLSNNQQLYNITFEYIITDNNNNELFNTLYGFGKDYRYYINSMNKKDLNIMKISGCISEKNTILDNNSLYHTLTVGVPDIYSNPESLNIKLINLAYHIPETTEVFEFQNSEFEFNIDLKK